MHYLTAPPSDPTIVAGLMGVLCFYYWNLWR